MKRRRKWLPLECWPDLRVTVHPLPWCWKVLPYLYVDDVTGWRGYVEASWLFVQVEWWANTPTFRERRA